jgi:hypothetical protein
MGSEDAEFVVLINAKKRKNSSLQTNEMRGSQKSRWVNAAF